MKEFIEKLIGSLEEAAESNCYNDYGAAKAYDNSIEIIKELAEEYNNTSTEHINCSTDDVAQTERNKIIERLERFCDAECNGICYECEVPSAIRLLKEGE